MKPKSYILNKHKIDSLQFVKSNEYYSKDLEKYLYIYESVLRKLELNKEIVLDTIEKIRTVGGFRGRDADGRERDRELSRARYRSETKENKQN